MFALKQKKKKQKCIDTTDTREINVKEEYLRLIYLNPGTCMCTKFLQ